MQEATVKAPLFIEAFYNACESLRKDGAAVPNVRLINRILVKHTAGYEIRTPDLISTDEELKANHGYHRSIFRSAEVREKRTLPRNRRRVA
jgi:hypothetical protein